MKSDDIQNDIERTRGEMAHTLEEIERKLSPRQLMDQAVDTMRDIATDSTRIGRAVRENPLPLALIGLGIGWLAISGMRGRDLGDMMEEGEEAITSAGSTWVSPMVESGSEAMTGSRTQRLKDRAADMAAQARDTLSSATERTRERVGEWSSTARARAGQAADTTWDTYQQHPLTMGVAAAILGAALGALLPRTRPEGEYLGEAAGNLIRAGREAGTELVDRASRIASRAVRTARQEGAETLRAVKEELKAGESPSVPPPSSLTH